MISKIKSQSFIFVILSFLMPCFILTLAYAVFGMYPFGDKSVLIMDMSNQYVEFFAGLRNIVFGGQSLLYSWNKSFGGNFIGLFAYYLSSPLSFITLLFPARNLQEALLVVNILKIGLAGLTFSLFLKHVFKKKDISIVIFSLLYALMSYNIVYSMCLMWLDGVIWLPVILIGVEKIIKDGRFTLFTVSLALMFMSNYYISYPVGLFTFIYFLYRSFNTDNFGIKAFIKKSFVFAGGVLLSAACSAWLLVPAFFDLMQGKIGGSNYKPDFIINFDFHDILSKLFVGSYDSITNNGLPSIFCGILIILLLGFYLASGEIRLKEKISSIIVIAILLLSFYFTKVDMAWHVFQYPNWFPYRYAFLFSFFIIMLAYRGFLGIKSLKPAFFAATLAVMALAMSALIYFVATAGYEYLKNKSIILTIIFAAAYIIMLAAVRWKGTRTVWAVILSLLLLIMSSVEMYFNTEMLVRGLDNQFYFNDREAYVNFRDELIPLIENVKNSDKGFYRMEKTFERSKNDSIGLGYNAITHYSSTYNDNVNTLTRKLGFLQGHFWSSYFGSTIVTDSLFAVKYVMSKTSPNGYYINIDSNNDITMYQNPYALSLAYMADKQLLSVDVANSWDPYELQNNILKSMLKENRDFYKKIGNVQMETSNLNIEDFGYFKKYTPIDESKAAYISFTFNAPDDNLIYASFPTGSWDTCNLYVNGNYVGEYFTTYTKHNLLVGAFKKGEKINVKLELKESHLDLDNYLFYSFDMTAFESAIATLRKSELDIEYFDPTHIKGTVNAENANILFTSIPFDEGWSIWVNGEKQKPLTFANTFMCIEVPEGTNKIELKYSPKGFKTGVIISIAGIAAFSIILSVCWIKRRRQTVCMQHPT